MSTLTAKQEAFALRVAEGATQADAYRQAYSSKAKRGYYTYMLVDPRDGEAFYVGKGKGNRVSHHAKLAFSDHSGNEAKNSKIRDIVNCGYKVDEQILCYYGDDEKMALDAEKELISMLKDSLTNISGGSSQRGSVVVKTANALMKDLAPAWWIERYSPFKNEIEEVFGSVQAYCDSMKANLTEIIKGVEGDRQAN